MATKLMGSAAVIFDEEGKVLLVKHTYGKLNWELPGGFAELNESLEQTAIREAFEETGLCVIATDKRFHNETYTGCVCNTSVNHVDECRREMLV